MNLPQQLTIKISVLETAELWLASLGLSFLIMGLGTIYVYLDSHHDRFYSGIYIQNVSIAGLTKAQALIKLNQLVPASPLQIQISVDDIKIASSGTQLGVHRDYQAALNQGFNWGRHGWLPARLTKLFFLQWQPLRLSAPLAIDDTAGQQLIDDLARGVDVIGQSPQAKLKYSGSAASLVIDPGRVGRQVNRAATWLRIRSALADQETSIDLAAVVASSATTLSPEQIKVARQRAGRLVNQSLRFTAQERTLQIDDQDLISLISLPDGYQEDKLATLAIDWAKRLDRPAQEPEFSYDQTTLKVSKFIPPLDGLTLNQDQTIKLAAQSIQDLETQLATQSPVPIKTNLDVASWPLPVTTTKPQKSLASTNNLGIKELVGYGDSAYAHSIPNRIHNVALTAGKINLTIIKPDKEFSFNRTLGEVSSSTGFKPAYVISEGKTILGDGGGVCQVSTTLFRAVLNAGLPVTKRQQHSYRVSYYELNAKPGIDATVYAGDTDLRFVNDTGHHLLIYTQTDSQNLTMYVAIYGTSDGRTTQIVDHQVWDYRPPPSPVYLLDASLPLGVVRQVDWAVSGVKAKFTNMVWDKNGQEIRRDEYYSNYIPWSAKYLRGG